MRCFRFFGKGLGFACLFLFTLTATSGRAQTEPAPAKSFAVGLALVHLQAVEGALYPRRNTGPALQLDLRRRRISGEQEREWQLHLQYGRPRTTIEREAASHWVRLRFRYGQLWPVAQGPWGRLQAGPVGLLHYQVAYYEALDDSHLYWANHATLGAGLQWQSPQLKLTGKGFQARLDVPVLGLGSRPPHRRPYKIDDLSGSGLLRMFHGQLRPVGWGQLLAPQAELAYGLGPAGRRTRTAFYGLEYQRFSLAYSRPYRHLLHQAGFRLTL